MKFYGREKELALLRKIREDAQGASRLTIVTGRRRIGKTELLRQAYGDTFLYFFVTRRTEKELCESFKSEIGEKLGEFIPGEQTRFADIFRWILAYSRNRPLTLVIDEFQDFLRINPAIYSEMQRRKWFPRDRRSWERAERGLWRNSGATTEHIFQSFRR